MENHIGLAFTSEAIILANFQVDAGKKVLSNLDKIAYPFQYEENIIFLEDNIVRLSNILLNKFKALHINSPAVSISIESNLSLLKRIEIPHGLDEKEEFQHIQWDLNNSLINPVEEYFYLKTNNVYDRNTHKEVLVVAIRKNILEFFKSLINFSKLKLINLSTNNLAAELCFQNTFKENNEEINLLYKVNSDRIEFSCLLEKKLFMSEYIKLKPTNSRSIDEILLEKITNYKNKTENYFEHLTGSAKKVNNIFLYGMGFQDNFVERLSKNVSTEVAIINPLININTSKNLDNFEMKLNELSEFVESIGITLDSD